MQRVVRSRTHEVRLDPHRTAIDIRRDPHAVDPARRQRLEPDGLPDAAGACVVTALRLELPELLAARLALLLRVHHPHDQAVGTRAQEGRYVETEGHVPSPVRADATAVHPDRRLVI